MPESPFNIPLLTILILAAALAGLTGCAQVNAPSARLETPPTPTQTPVMAAESGTHEERLAELHQAEELLRQGNTLSASIAFMVLDTPSTPLDLRLRARYGLAVAALLSAGSQQEFDKALTLWRDWAEHAGEGLADPRLLAPLLPRLAPDEVISGAKAPLDVAESQPEGLAGQLPGGEEFIPRIEGQFNTNAQIEDLKRQLAWSERERGRLADQLKAELNETVRKNLDLSDANLSLSLENQRLRERQLTQSLENERLREQLKALQDLHLEITRKKKVVE